MSCTASNKADLMSLMTILLATTSFHAAAATPSAISVPVRTNWYGYDGNWSPVSIRVGTPPQWIDVFVSTAAQETWVVGPGGCDGTVKCETERGGKLFQANESSTWQDQGAFVLGLDPQLGFNGNGIYGFDSIAFGDEFSVPSQVIGVINTTDYWLGFFGLGVEPTNFTSSDKPTFLDSMVENQSLIPSHCYGYTAGAHYRLSGIPSSLTLGGFDTNRFDTHDISFELDVAQSPVIALNNINVIAQPLDTSNISTGWDNNKAVLLEPAQADLFIIDSSTPFLWLPEAVCFQFENALGLAYDEELQLYTFGNESSHDTLVDWNLTFQFLVADMPGSSKSVSLSFPYAAFDLELSYPYPHLNATQASPPTNYFPLRKAANATQYTLGRSFLQETYLIVDYERNNFSISQAAFPQDALQNFNLIDIIRPRNSTFAGPAVAQQGSPLTKADIAGVAVGVAVAFILLIVILHLGFHLRQDYANKAYIKDDSEDKTQRRKRTSGNRLARWLFCLPKSEAPTEIGKSKRFAFEAPSDNEIMELPVGRDVQSELERSSTDVPAYQEADSKHGANIIWAVGHDPKKPVELPFRSSARGYFEPETASQIQLAAPAFVPAKQGNWRGINRQDSQTTAGVSSPSNTQSRRSSKESSPIFVVSPVTPRENSPAFSSLDTVSRRGAWYLATASKLQGAPTSIEQSHPVARSESSEEISVSTVTNKIRRSVTRGFAPGVHNLAASDVRRASNAPIVTHQNVSSKFSRQPAQTTDNENFANSPPCSTCPSQRAEAQTPSLQVRFV